ncbi:hypothetical protein HDU67_001140, partial [Dinochytrium kinnereticum]
MRFAFPSLTTSTQVILKEAGRDATAAFQMFHSKDILDTLLPPSACLGVIDPASSPSLAPHPPSSQSPHSSTSSQNEPQKESIEVVPWVKPPLSAMFNAFDFESVARRVLSPEAWAYYSSGSDDEITLRENHAVFQRILLRPRIMVNVKDIDLTTRMLGTPVSLPIYITSCALGRLGHPDGEMVLTKAAGRADIIQMMPTLASCSLDEMMDAALPGQTQWFQLYVNADRAVTERIVRKAEGRGVKGLFVTVDAPQLGRREKDMRVKFIAPPPTVQKTATSIVPRTQGAARAISTFIDPSLSWSDLPWLLNLTTLPVLLKGVQHPADAVLAARYGCSGIVVSNHGGRQLDTVRSGVEVLVEVVAALLGVSGIRRGVDGTGFEVHPEAFLEPPG